MMLQPVSSMTLVRVDDGVTSGSVVVGDGFERIPYSPDLLLPFPALDVRLLNQNDFVEACEWGYDDYFEMMYEDAPDDLLEGVFVHRGYTVTDVAQYLHENLRPDPHVFPHVLPTSLAWRAGFVFGWLSALSKYDASLAATSVAFFVALVKVLQECSHV